MFLARLSELRAIATFVEAFCAQSGVARDRCLRLNVVLEELLINTVRHGHRGECDAPVWVSVCAQPAQVELTYEDTAGPFNPLAYTARPGRPGKIGGLGVLLTRELSAAREYAYLFGRNRIRLALAT